MAGRHGLARVGCSEELAVHEACSGVTISRFVAVAGEVCGVACRSPIGQGCDRRPKILREVRAFWGQLSLLDPKG